MHPVVSLLANQFCYFNETQCCGYESQVTKANSVNNAQVFVVVQQHILQT